ncbi:MAG: DNA-binding protein WhiA [Candidatus Sericytochromatia bacterium]|nr:DNA-binding protein WhiA [Candidatus Sericytochromatia bacterium]
MSFSRDVRNQLTQMPLEKTCCQQAHLLAFAVVSGSEAASLGGQPHFIFNLDNAAIARHLFRIGKSLYATRPVVEARREQGKRPSSYRVAIPIGAHGMLPATLTVEQLCDAIARKTCCRRSFLRGAFMAGGSLVAPTKAYHLEFNTTEDVALWIQDLLAREEVASKVYQRAPHSEVWTVYVKDGNGIAAFLTALGAHQALMRWEEVRVGKDLVNSVQRVVNCETANLNRTLTSSQRQVAEIAWLKAHRLLDSLPEDCQLVAQARLDAPYASLIELGDRFTPPLSKSAVNHRLKQLHKLYQTAGGPQLADGGDPE